jgi:hypothetical protein
VMDAGVGVRKHLDANGKAKIINRETGDARFPIDQLPVWFIQNQEVRSPAAWQITSAAILTFIFPMFNIMW